MAALCLAGLTLGVLCLKADAQTAEWAWMGGSSATGCTATSTDTTCGQAGSYGTLGTPAASNAPGSRVTAATWTDTKGNLWLFGGFGLDSTGTNGVLNDVWELSPSTREWVWIGGSSTVGCSDCGQPGVYGTLGTPAPANIPGGRGGASTWTDSSGNFWLFGGQGFDSTGQSGPLNDLWEFNPSTHEWAWMAGPSTYGPPGPNGANGIYGTLGVPAPGNVPGGRYTANSWIDSSGNLWLFGGLGFDSAEIQGALNDLWEFNPATREWAWMGGSSSVGCGGCGQAGIYGTMGTPAAQDVPGGRWFASNWTDSGGNLWLFGGFGYDSSGATGSLNDLWRFNVSSRQWTWMGGNSTLGGPFGRPGIYGTLGTAAAGNVPGGRAAASSWTDRSGNFWLFGGGGLDSTGLNNGFLNDLWEFNPSTGEWAWMSGSSTAFQAGVYGTLGEPAAGNVPGARQEATSWIDRNGNLWLLGGQDVDSTTTTGYLNDLWEYQPSATTLPAATPTFGLPAGTYSSAQTVTISDATTGATIFYTTNGTTPTTASTQYTSAITVNSTETIEAMATASGYSTSALATATYTITTATAPPAATPTFSIPSGTYSSAQTVTISDAMAGATIYYTTNGTTPTTASTQYTSAITVNSTETLEAIAVATGYTASVVATAAYRIGSTPTFTTLVDLGATNGANPYFMSLIQGADGNLYGTTSDGGADDPPNNDGSVFKITVGGTLTTLYSFCPQTGCTDGVQPDAGLVQATNGNFYGTTALGGAKDDGTVFEITPGGTLTTLHSFSFNRTDGGFPYGALIQATDGNLYGTTELGGPSGYGTIFEITPGGTLTTLYSFGGTDGASPYDGLIQATDGNFYGTTSQGGANGDGTVFRITPGGALTTLHNFAGLDGSDPEAGLIQAADGNFYGTMAKGGANGDGTVFKITPGGTLTTLHNFAGTDGSEPSAGLVQATDGNFYGTTSQGGADNDGTVFEITPGGTLATLHSFAGTDGIYPLGGLVQTTDGNFYGTTYQDGGVCCGTVFRLGVGLGPFVEAEPTSGAVGTPVIILGNNLTGATGVSFNGTAATFTVASSSEINTTVPVGSTTGIVQVTTPSGTLNSNLAFQVASPQAAMPTFNPAPGTYSTVQSVTLSDATTGAVIYYTTNGTAPTTASTQYTSAITVSSTETIEAMATASGYSTSSVATATYTITLAASPPAATPSFSIPSGTYPSAQTVTITDALTGATIYYTTNGTTPTTASTQYTGAITVNSTETIEAIAVATGYTASAVATATYTIGVQPQGGPSVSSAYQELHQRVVANAANFYVYRDQDSGLNHGYPSGWFGTTSAITIDTGCIDNPADTVTGCYPSSNTTALDLARGTVFRVTFAPLSSGQFAGLNIEEPLNWGADGQPASNSYNLTGATAVSLDVRSPNSAKVEFGVGGCVTNFLTVGPSWTTMTIPISSLVPPPDIAVTCPPNLSNTHLLFTITTNSTNDPSTGPGATVLLDNIQFTPTPTRSNQGSETLSLPVSTQTFGAVPQTQAFPPDQANRNIAAIYEAALSLIGFLARGTPQDLADAQTIANALDYALHNDNQGDPLPVAPGGFRALHNAYSSGDLALLNGQTTGALAGNVRLAGFTCGSASPTGFCLELDGATGGNNAFAILSLLAAYRQFGNTTYLNDAVEIANWVVGNLKDATGTGYGGYYVGYPDQGQIPKVLIMGKSIENNADIFAAFTALAAIENQLGNVQQAAQWTANAKVAGDFVVQMFDTATGHFFAGTVLVGSPPNPAAGNCQTPYMSKGNDVINTCDFLDSNTFTTLAMAGSEAYKNSIDWTKPINYAFTVYPQTITANGLTFQGVDIIPPPPAGVAWEFTGQFAETCQYIAALLSASTCGTLAQTYLAQIGQAQASAPFEDGIGLVAATVNGENAPPNNLPPLDECLATPFQCIPERVGLAATVWAILATENLNVFWPFPGANTSPGSLTFTGQQVGTTSAAQTVTLSNTGSVSLSVSSITATGTNASAFTETNTCGANLAVGAKCTISVTFTPMATGTLTAGLTITSTALTSPQTVSLTGTGTGQNFALAVSAGSSLSQTVSPGGTATYTLSATSLGGFNQVVSLACNGAPTTTTCQVSPTSVTPSSSGTPVTVTVTTTAPSAAAPRSPHLPLLPPLSPGLNGLLIFAALLAAMAWRLVRRNQPGRSQWQLTLIPFAVGLLVILAFSGCGGGGGGGTTSTGTLPGMYNLTVTGTSGSGSAALTHTVTLTLNVS